MGMCRALFPVKEQACVGYCRHSWASGKADRMIYRQGLTFNLPAIPAHRGGQGPLLCTSPMAFSQASTVPAAGKCITAGRGVMITPLWPEWYAFNIIFVQLVGQSGSPLLSIYTMLFLLLHAECLKGPRTSKTVSIWLSNCYIQ